jgi:mono/diheme cytochrome c family protein
MDAGAEQNDAAFPLDELPATAQRPGDPAAGYDRLVNGGYVGCGVPYSAWTRAIGPAPEALRLPGRTGPNETLSYDFNAFTTSSSVVVVSSNCLTCHASVFEGQLIVGLGDPNRDFTNDASSTAEAVGVLISDPAERAEWRKWADRIQATAPYLITEVVGVNPADNLAGILFAHRDPETLAWSSVPLLEPPPQIPLPVDVPPWWRYAKKNALYYNGGGRGDHARLMMTASVLCVDTVGEARSIDDYFPDVRAYLASLEPPPYPREVDQAMAERGQDVFLATCSRCHGTYGEAGTYPNNLVSLEEVETDPWLAASAHDGARFRDWFSRSFYGEIASLEATDGYVAPPLDGIWLTAPYLHNGSVPTLRALLDSSTRPTYFTRGYDGNGYDYEDLGWPYTELDHGHAGEPNQARRKLIYDTTLPGHSNAGHTFGDALTEEDRSAVIEYLKTL